MRFGSGALSNNGKLTASEVEVEVERAPDYTVTTTARMQEAENELFQTVIERADNDEGAVVDERPREDGQSQVIEVAASDNVSFGD